MALEDRRARDRAARHRLILDTARTLAESEGWDAVTTRRLAAEIEYSQPVIYKHFAGMEAIAEALAVDGFGELAEVLRAARTGAGENPLIPTAHAYLSFAGDNPALYDAMFLRATGLRFASEDTPAPLKAAFAQLRNAVAAVSGEAEADTRTEVFWAALHGLVTLGRGGRLRPNLAEARIELLVAQFGQTPARIAVAADMSPDGIDH
ncbi:TetR/AcrR family transcriptional regulator [Mycolicibacterium confluentis]|uniref:TetR family transcriptional regulator n=1 Tax=Mycolicibacterium confluentis TaxID=28047 RepID=A0A7I7XV00_9MYCO|nr:TetR/AcrR family transcriptional regulator [Mycolicibacterium confluentis]MCV7318044.1 TetR/AcrR family transcriptional regulator [Mycolicibacterium confluentis]ORV32528.1 TetR family transcriptional regulator [Mycolicibacterium confluentis]BBZ33095.1 TetR family transcriptional regulator [Mycolicibacterium confluentis]